MTILCPITIAAAAGGLISGVSIAGIGPRIVRRLKRPIEAAPPAVPKCRQAIELMHNTAQTAFGRKPFRPRDVWALIGPELTKMGIDSTRASWHIWHESRNGGLFLRTEDHGYYVVAAEAYLAIDHIKPNAIIINRKFHSRLGPLVATIFAISGWWLKSVHLTDIVDHIHHLSG